MTALPTAAALVSLALLFLVRYAMHALRSFSRRDLSDRCDAAGKTDRFGAILLCRDRAIEDLAAASLLAATAYGGAIFAAAGGFQGGWAAAGYLVGASAAMLLAGGLLPWAAARVSAEGFLVGCWPAVDAFLKVSGPARSFADRIDRAAHRLVGRPDPDEHDTTDVVEGEILAVVEQGQDDGVIKPGVRRMIDRVVSLGEADAARVMTPRTKMNVLRATATVEQARAEFLEAGHSRMPVIGESTDDVVGLLYAKDLLPSLDGRGSFEDPTAAITPLLREPVFVPETLGIDALLDQMKRQQRHLVIVVDEYGGVSGLITLEDILEEIVGDILDEYDDESAGPPEKVRRDGGLLELDASVRIDELNDAEGLELPEDGDFDTVGGFVYDQLGKVPSAGESFTFKNVAVEVLQADRRRVERVRIKVERNGEAVGA